MASKLETEHHLKTEFSPWLTTVIGGRGSGKSTIVNYLRIALARIDEMPDEVQAEFNKFNSNWKEKCNRNVAKRNDSIKVANF